jgi:hypothetical protein
MKKLLCTAAFAFFAFIVLAAQTTAPLTDEQKSKVNQYLKTKRGPEVAELFVSLADGTKAAFFGKTTSWSHKGKPKHDVPMSGKTWVGPPELDQSSGKVSVQVSFPVPDGGKPIGSIVVGLEVSKL